MRPNTIRVWGVLAAAAMLAIVSGTAARAQQGKVEIVGGDTHNWGTVEPGKLQARMQLKNIGKGPINILEVRPTCLCTIAPVDKKFLKPGEIATVDITLDATGKVGRVERSIRILTVDSTTATRAIDTSWIHLKAEVKPEITVTPAQSLIVGSAKKGEESHVLPLKIKNTSDNPVTFELPELQKGANVTARFGMTEKKTLKPGEEFEFRAEITPTVDGPMSGVVLIRTSDVRMPVLRLVVAGRTTAAPNTVPQTTPKSTH